MGFDLNRATQFRQVVEDGPINSIIKNAQKAYPNECCGFILENGAIFPAQNIVETLSDKSVTSKTAFLIDNESWKIANENVSRILCIYHSHTNGSPDMSEMDRYSLRWPDLCYLIIGLIDTNPTHSKLFWWQDKDLHELDITL